MAFSLEFKKAVTKLPEAEKDKLIFRLLKLNPDLIKRLEFELVEQGETLEDRREEIQKYILKLLKSEPYSPGYLMMDLRTLSGEITRHVKTTRDKYGEIVLSLFMLKYCLEQHGKFVLANKHRAQNFEEYAVKRLQTILEKVTKLHPDLHLEFTAYLDFILQELHRLAPHLATKYKLPKQLN